MSETTDRAWLIDYLRGFLNDGACHRSADLLEADAASIADLTEQLASTQSLALKYRETHNAQFERIAELEALVRDLIGEAFHEDSCALRRHGQCDCLLMDMRERAQSLLDGTKS